MTASAYGSRAFMRGFKPKKLIACSIKKQTKKVALDVVLIGKVSQLISDEPVVRLLPDDGSVPVLISISALLRSRGVHIVSTRQTKGLSVVKSRGAACTGRNSETCTELFGQIQIWPLEEKESEVDRVLEKKPKDSNKYESDEELVQVVSGIIGHASGTPLRKGNRKPIKEHNNIIWERMVKNCLKADGKKRITLRKHDTKRKEKMTNSNFARCGKVGIIK